MLNVLLKNTLLRALHMLTTWTEPSDTVVFTVTLNVLFVIRLPVTSHGAELLGRPPTYMLTNLFQTALVCDPVTVTLSMTASCPITLKLAMVAATRTFTIESPTG